MNMTQPFHQALRSGIHAPHQALHHHPLLAGLGTGDVTRQQWLSALVAFHAFYALYEPQAQRATTFEQAPVMDWLDRDFAVHNITPPRLPTRYIALNLDDTSGLLAYLYVKQGSTLGGQVISKKLRQTLGLIGGEDQYFFYGYGAYTGEKWKLFLSQLAQASADADVERTVEAAQLLFAQLAEICDVAIQESTC